MSEITKEYMAGLKGCTGVDSVFNCVDCPFVDENSDINGVSDCFKTGVAVYLESKNKPATGLTLKDITDAMHSGTLITHKGFEGNEYIYFSGGIWKDEKRDPAGHVTFHDLENWSFWVAPNPAFKKHTISIWLDEEPKPGVNGGDLDESLIGYNRGFTFESQGDYDTEYTVTIEKVD